MQPSKFIAALQGKNTGRPPVWLMRQAGRYLPEYRALRAKHSLRELFFTPELAKEITLMPLRRYELDAAIIFSDITAIAPALGFSLEFSEGPITKRLSHPINLSLLDPIGEAVRLTKSSLTVPLIGFCGGPFTIATYLAPDWRDWPSDQFTDFLEQICEVCIASLRLQIEAGADAVQIFDSWANLLEGEEFQNYSLHYLKKIIDQTPAPTILFMRGSSLRAEMLAELNPTAISLDWDRPILDVRSKVKLPLQGNLDPDLLLGPQAALQSHLNTLLQDMKNDPAFILNIGHGLKPTTPLEAVASIIAQNKSFV